MEIVNTHDAKSRLSQLLARVAKGEEFIIARAGKPLARLIAFRSEEGERTGGHWKGLVRISEDFDDPLPDDLAGPFTGQS